MLIKGEKLSPAQRAEVLRAFVHRWTVENAQQTYGGKCPGCEQGAPAGFTREQWHAYHMPLTTDEEWISGHAFHFTKNGHVSSRVSHCEPAYMAD